MKICTHENNPLYGTLRVYLDFTVGDGRLGYPDKAPYDAIHVGAAAAIVPESVS